MGTYDRYTNYTEVANRIREGFKYYCIELQLVWLAELLILHYYILCKDLNKKYLRQLRDFDVFTPTKVAKLLDEEKMPSKVYNKLVSFRNTYVHAGSQSAFEIFKDLYNNYQLELIELARIVDVNLNFNCVLYKILEKRTVN